MKINVDDLLRINKGFGGNVVRTGSLEFAVEKFESKKLGLYSKLAYLFRAILVDHPISNGNKKTAMFFAFMLADANRKNVNRNLLIHQILSIAQKNIIDIRKIKRRIMTAIK